MIKNNITLTETEKDDLNSFSRPDNKYADNKG